jgi:hypothetical protein
VTGDDTPRLLTVIPVAQLIVSTGHGRITPCPHPGAGRRDARHRNFACPPNPITEKTRHVRPISMIRIV